MVLPDGCVVTRNARRARASGAPGRALRVVVTAVVAATAAAAPVHADSFALHRITYIVTSDATLDADVYYRDVDPPTWADYSHNPYQFNPRDEAILAPERPWVREVTLTDPDKWAMVAISRASSASDGTIRCALAVDGVTVATAEGTAGAVCSLRNW
jgi:hypothetical protein